MFRRSKFRFRYDRLSDAQCALADQAAALFTELYGDQCAYEVHPGWTGWGIFATKNKRLGLSWVVRLEPLVFFIVERPGVRPPGENIVGLLDGDILIPKARPDDYDRCLHELDKHDITKQDFDRWLSKFPRYNR